MENKENLFILGPSGVGKSHLAQAIGHEACRRGYDTLFCTYQLFEWIYAGRGDGTQKKRLAQVIKMPLVIRRIWLANAQRVTANRSVSINCGKI